MLWASSPPKRVTNSPNFNPTKIINWLLRVFRVPRARCWFIGLFAKRPTCVEKYLSILYAACFWNTHTCHHLHRGKKVCRIEMSFEELPRAQVSLWRFGEVISRAVGPPIVNSVAPRGSIVVKGCLLFGFGNSLAEWSRSLCTLRSKIGSISYCVKS